ncbi:hypothetical protein GCK32_018051 [Trichostrongylus colubriformis]|uniref:Uncharacterized protein n=1 Tax=Trichostrongylus colubriformis TaxID=6319 RepID=A0AAN8IEF1_TRICO
MYFNHAAQGGIPTLRASFLGAMSLLSTIRRKSSVTGAGTVSGTIPNKAKKLVMQEWPRVLECQPDLFSIAWSNSAARSNSVKKAFGIGVNENPADNETFMKVWPSVQDFFHKLVRTYFL